MTDEARGGASAQRSSIKRPTHSPSGRDAKRKRFRAASIIFATLLVLTIAAGGWLAFRAQQIRSNLDSAVSLAPELRAAASDRDTERAREVTGQLSEHTTEAREAGTDPLWRAASLIPILGPNFSAISEVTVSADDVVSRAISPMLDTFDSLDWDSLTPSDGRINVGPLQEVAPTLSSAANTVQLSYERLSSIDQGRLLPQVASPLEQALGTMDEARLALNRAASAAEVLPPMMGMNEPRTYLVLIQNSAEIRATGGIPGAYAVIRTDDGSIELTGQGSATDLGEFDPPIEVSADQTQIYSNRLGRFLQSTNLTPNFPTVAQTTKDMYETRYPDTTIDGVIGLDAVVLASILEVTGPIELGEFEDPVVAELVAGSGLPLQLTSGNVVQTLLSDTYARVEEPALQDVYFASVASQIFSALADGQGETTDMLEALTRSSEENRLYLWSNESQEQDVIGATQFGGAATGATKGGASFGVYFNDGTGAKMDYYVRRTVQVLQACSSDDASAYTVRVTLTNTAPVDAVESLPEYVTGGGAFGIPAGEVRTNTVSYGPAQSTLTTATVDGEEVPIGSFRQGSRPIGILTTQLAPGESSTLEYRFTSVVQTDIPALAVTPTIQPIADVVLPFTAEAGCE